MALKNYLKRHKIFCLFYGTDYVELYVGNAKQAAHYYKTALGFSALLIAG
jgi:4-hydroxyphenylpyruvate dioxygenase